ncbi:MAG: serine hydrolase [Cytophagales bacterium]|nr:serine hydrolase [Cytophagales bacterium]
MKQKLLLLALFYLYPNLGFGQVNAQKIERYIENARKAWGVPGMSVAVVKEGEIVTCKGYGVLEEGGDKNVDANSLFAIASNTKAFVSSALGVLHQEGKMSLDHKVRRYLPGFQLYDAYASSEASVTDLLCHRIGLGTYSGDVIWYKTDFTAGDVIDRIRYVPQAYGFRGGYGYSNLMFITAGEVIHAVSGLPWEEFVAQKFFHPLGMDRTVTTIDDLDAKGNYATPHKPVGEMNLPIAWVNWDNMGAAGGIISSANDMARWLIFQLNNGVLEGDTLLNPSIQNLLWTPHNNYTVGLESRERNPGTNFAGYGLGWGVSDYFGNRMITHGGGYDGMYSQVAMLPELGLGIVILTNTMKSIATPLRYYIINAFIEKDRRDWSAEALKRGKQRTRVDEKIEAVKKARRPGTRPTLELSDYAGVYHTHMLGNIIVSESNGRLKLEFVHAPDLSAELRHWHMDTWEIRWDKVHAWFDFGTVRFLLNTELNVTGFEFDVPNHDIFFHELNVEKIN